MDKFKENGVKFLELNYKIPQLVSSTNRIASGTMTVDWCGYAAALLLVFDDVESLRK
jgi:hypothetical protein